MLQDRFIPKTELTKRKRRTNDLDELLKNYPKIKDVIFDGSELPIKRPKRRQKQSYSGKKKHHTKKFQLGLDKKTKLIVALSYPKKGKIHDKKQMESIGWDDKLSDDVNRYGDLEYLGMDNWVIPDKKPKGEELTEEQKKGNRKISRERISVEHGIRGVKIFRRIGELITIKQDEFLFNALLAAANLYNFKRLMRQGIS